MRVEIIISDYAYELQKEINKFIEKIEKEHMEVVDIKYERISNVDSDCYVYSALIMYKRDGRLYLHTDILSPAEYHAEFGV